MAGIVDLIANGKPFEIKEALEFSLYYKAAVLVAEERKKSAAMIAESVTDENPGMYTGLVKKNVVPKLNKKGTYGVSHKDVIGYDHRKVLDMHGFEAGSGVSDFGHGIHYDTFHHPELGKVELSMNPNTDSVAQWHHTSADGKRSGRGLHHHDLDNHLMKERGFKPAGPVQPPLKTEQANAVVADDEHDEQTEVDESMFPEPAKSDEFMEKLVAFQEQYAQELFERYTPTERRAIWARKRDKHLAMLRSYDNPNSYKAKRHRYWADRFSDKIARLGAN